MTSVLGRVAVHFATRPKISGSSLSSLCQTSLDGSQPDLAGAPIDVHQALAAGCGADEALAAALHRELQAAAPGDGEVAVDLEDVVLQHHLDELLPGAVALQCQNAAPLDAQIEQALVAQGGGGQVGAHDGLVLELRLAGQEQAVVQHHIAAPLGGARYITCGDFGETNEKTSSLFVAEGSLFTVRADFSASGTTSNNFAGSVL